MHMYDVVIVGAGLSGLMAAYELRDWDILVLEKEGRSGGRIFTRSKGDVSYDLGAVFAIDNRVLPSEFTTSHLICEDERIGLFIDGRVHYGAGVMECLSCMGIDAQDREAIRRFRVDQKHDAHLLPESIYKILNAFFQVIHPGEMEEYLPQRRLDALVKYGVTHYEKGNGEFIGQFEERLGPRVRLAAEVLSVAEEREHVRLKYRHHDKRREVLAKTVILTPPAPAVLKMFDSMSDSCGSFLSSLRYGEGTVVALGFQETKIADFSYIVTPDLPTSTILKQSTTDGSIQVLLAYYAGNKSVQLKGWTDGRIIEQTLDVLGQLQIAAIEKKNIIFSDVCPWPILGPVISEESYSKWDERVVRPTKRVFLGGEYVYVNPHNVLPYGMVPALCSGKKASGAVRQFLKNEIFESEFLVHVSRYEITADQPVFRGYTEEGNIAFYGLILQAGHDEHLKQYLLHNSRDSLWEWQKGFGVTAEDSALVIEGLLEAGVNGESLLPRLQRLVELFFSRTDGAFQTILNGRAMYWRGPSVDATAHIGYLLQRIAPSIYQKEIEACARYLQASQHEQGYWHGKWFPSTMITTYYATRLLCGMEHHYTEIIDRARQYILAGQKADGGWGDSVIETSAAILALGNLGMERSPQLRAKEWLLAKKGKNGWQGEPVLYYWFEIAPDRKLFFHCHDKGQITTAWATLALNTFLKKIDC